MQARRSSTPTPPLPSSPPSVFQQLGEAYSPPEAREIASPAQTVWTAPSPTRTLGHSSPELPSLPSFSALRNNPHTPSTAARHERTDTSYYTASWGSPYRHPPPSFNPQRQVSTNFGSDDLEGESSNLQFGLEHLLPSRFEIEEESPNRFNLEHLIPRLEQDASPNQFTLEHLIRSRLPNLETPTKQATQSGNTPRASDPNPTSEEWVQRFLGGLWNQETNDWRSDKSTDTDELSTNEEVIPLAPPPKRGHKVRPANKTLNQQDFWRHFSKDQKEALGKMMASKYAVAEPRSHSRQASEAALVESRVTDGHTTHENKAPMSSSVPVSTEEPRTIDESPDNPAGSVASQPIQESLSKPLPETPSKQLTSSEPVRSATPRIRKKVIVKGKGCIISIPRDIPRGTPGYPPKPMSAEAMKAKLQHLDEQGYDTQGFSSGGVPPHNRSIWPDEADIRDERSNAASRYRVRISKQAEWESYKQTLVEAKLAALGVSVGGEEDIPLPPSRSASTQQYPYIISGQSSYG
jgi:hypothetical protein